MCSVSGSLEMGLSSAGAPMESISCCSPSGSGRPLPGFGAGVGDLLLGGFVAGIDLSGVEELSEGALLIAGREQLSSFGEVGGGGGDAHAIKCGAVA
jgi:hypothetical protein